MVYNRPHTHNRMRNRRLQGQRFKPKKKEAGIMKAYPLRDVRNTQEKKWGKPNALSSFSTYQSMEKIKETAERGGKTKKKNKKKHMVEEDIERVVCPTLRRGLIQVSH